MKHQIKRNAEIFKLRREGNLSYHQIGLKFGLTGERVRMIYIDECQRRRIAIPCTHPDSLRTDYDICTACGTKV
jgi:hypothetical protein